MGKGRKAVRSQGRGPSGRSYRGSEGLTQKPKRSKGRKSSSTRWITRQLNDPYVKEAARRGYRSRAAIKLEQMNKANALLRAGMVVVDLGCAPGGWLQLAERIVHPGKGAARLVGVDILDTDEVAGARIIKGDFTDAATVEAVRAAIGGRADAVLSDMAANTTGHRATDHLRTTALLEAALEFAMEVLVRDGFFLAKTFRGGSQGAILDVMQHNFTRVRHLKPPASRDESVENYVLATGFRGGDAAGGSAKERAD